MTAYIQAATDFVAQNPGLAGLVVFLVAASEAIVVVGAFVPGTAILVAISAVVGLGHLPLWPILLAATLGAIAGDGFSYWFGHRYKHHLARTWPVSRRPELLDKGEAFFVRHGGKSIIIGRFVPVLRAIIPVVAGALGMPPGRFYAVNILSAVIWAPAHILPGAAVGLSLGVLGQISGRLAVALVLLVAAAVLAAWLLRLALLRLVPFADGLRRSWADRLRHSPPTPARRVLLAALDPPPDARTILPLGAILAAIILGFFSVLEEVVARGELARSDAAVSHFVQSLRTAWGDTIMVVITSFGDTVAITAVALAVSAWLAWTRAWRVLVGFLAALLLATAFATLLKAWVGIPRPIAIYDGAQVFSFPSGHATMSAALFGILAWITVRAVAAPYKRWVLAGFGALVGMIAISRIYLAAHWPSDVGGGLLFGFGIATLFAIVFRRFDFQTIQPGRLIAIGVATTMLFGAWHASRTLQAGLAMYAVRSGAQTSMTRSDWLAGGWRRLPERRIDFAGEYEEPFIVQWAGDVRALRDRLTAAGWAEAPVANFANGGLFLRASTSAAELPALPLMHDGALPLMTMFAPTPGMNDRIVLRAWGSGTTVTTAAGDVRLLLVSVRSETIERLLGFLTLPQSTGSAPVMPLSADSLGAVAVTGAGGRRVLLGPAVKLD